jgi:7,8-dihydropterin-6-yl-methyl-4-(beta-D-ribofuranosyl)aminobenzene 5'-phosphate synthase
MNAEELLNSATLTVVYDNLVYDDQYRTSHGFACIVRAEGGEGTSTLLFDTGGDFPTLAHNVSRAGCDFTDFDAVVISHDHYDHAGGLEGVLEKHPSVPVYLPGLGRSRHVGENRVIENPIQVDQEPRRIAYGIWSGGVLEGRMNEQSLALFTPRGVVLVTGCAHPGIVRIARTVKERSGAEVYLVAGGFHRPPASAARELLELGVRYAAPSHCTGEESTLAIKKAFGEGYIPSGAGRVLSIR